MVGAAPLFATAGDERGQADCGLSPAPGPFAQCDRPCPRRVLAPLAHRLLGDRWGPDPRFAPGMHRGPDAGV